MLAGVDDSDEVLGNDGHSGFSGDENMSFGVFGSPIVAFGQLGGMKVNSFVEMSKFV